MMRLAACILGRAQRRHGRAWDETKYSATPCVPHYSQLILFCFCCLISGRKAYVPPHLRGSGGGGRGGQDGGQRG